MLFNTLNDECPKFTTIAAEIGLPLQRLALALEVEHSVKLSEGNKLSVTRVDKPPVYYRLISSSKFGMEQLVCRNVVADFAIRDLRGLRMIG